MDWLILAIVQGLTEWLPISSSGHLVILQQFLKGDVLLDASLHLGTTLAVIVYMWKYLIDYLKDKQMLVNIGIAVLPITIIGYFFQDYIESAFSNPKLVSVLLIVNGIILLLTKSFNGNKTLDVKKSFYIGLAQVLALLPGISRSGVTISTGVFSGMNREKAARFSFAVSIIPLLGAFTLQWYKNNFVLNPLAVLVSFLVGLGAIHFLMRYIKNIHLFGYYCIAFGTINYLISLVLNIA